jgi:hypothetical protein
MKALSAAGKKSHTFLISFQIVIFKKISIDTFIGRVKGVGGKENTYTSSRDEAQEPTEFVCCLPSSQVAETASRGALAAAATV